MTGVQTCALPICSTIGHDVPAGALGIERAKQAEIDGWGERKLEKYIAKKQKLEAEKKGK